MYDYVRPAKVLVALQWLISNNPLYHDVLINTTWQDDAVQDDRDLLQAFLDKEFLDCPKNSSPMETDCLLDGNRQRNDFCLCAQINCGCSFTKLIGYYVTEGGFLPRM